MSHGRINHTSFQSLAIPFKPSTAPRLSSRRVELRILSTSLSMVSGPVCCWTLLAEPRKKFIFDFQSFFLAFFLSFVLSYFLSFSVSLVGFTFLRSTTFPRKILYLFEQLSDTHVLLAILLQNLQRESAF
jgi:hypothetical protein